MAGASTFNACHGEAGVRQHAAQPSGRIASRCAGAPRRARSSSCIAWCTTSKSSRTTAIGETGQCGRLAPASEGLRSASGMSECPKNKINEIRGGAGDDFPYRSESTLRMDREWGLLQSLVSRHGIPMTALGIETYGWAPRDAANRAACAVYGIALFSLTSNENDAFIEEFAKSTVESIEQINAQSDDQNRRNYESLRRYFEDIFNKRKLSFIRGNAEAAWQLFLERFNFLTGQLRANLKDLSQFLNAQEISIACQRDQSYFQSLPLSTEFVLTPIVGGAK